MYISYKPLWDLLKSRNMRKKDLIKLANLTTNCLASMSKNKYISMKNLRKICLVLNCEPNDIFYFKKNDEK